MNYRHAFLFRHRISYISRSGPAVGLKETTMNTTMNFVLFLHRKLLRVAISKSVG